MDSCRKEIVDGGVVNHAREREYEKDEGVLWGGGRERFQGVGRGAFFDIKELPMDLYDDFRVCTLILVQTKYLLHHNKEKCVLQKGS